MCCTAVPGGAEFKASTERTRWALKSVVGVHVAHVCPSWENRMDDKRPRTRLFGFQQQNDSLVNLKSAADAHQRLKCWVCSGCEQSWVLLRTEHGG